MNIDPTIATRVRRAAKAIAAAHPGGTIELRIPPYVAVQVGFKSGSNHRRGTPPNVVELDGSTFLELGAGRLHWDDLGPNQVKVSGSHAQEIARVFPFEERA